MSTPGRVLETAIDLTGSEKVSRFRFQNDQQRVFMIRTCILYGDMYHTPMLREKFWEQVRKTCIGEFNEQLGHCRQIVANIMKAFESTVKYEEGTSGVPILDTDLKQQCWNWKTNWIERVLSISRFHLSFLLVLICFKDPALKKGTTTVKIEKEEERQRALELRQTMMKNMADKPKFQAAKAALDTFAQTQKNVSQDEWQDISSDDTVSEQEGTTTVGKKRHKKSSKAAAKRERLEEIKEKNRHVRDREQHLEDSMSEDRKLVLETLKTVTAIAERAFPSPASTLSVSKGLLLFLILLETS